MIGFRRILFRLLFSKNEQTAVINALWHRANTFSHENSENQNYNMGLICKELAKKLMDL